MNRTLGITAIAALVFTATTAYGHPGHGIGGFGSGILHPLTGIDHLAAMIAVGLWAAQLGKRAVWAVPLAFLAMMLLGALLAFAHIQIPFTEQGIAASIFVFGLLIVFSLRMPASAGMFLVGLFAIFHGWAHGNEIAAGSSTITFGLGFLLSTAFLHALGLTLGLTLTHFRQQKLVRFAGLALIICSALLFTGVL